MAEDYSVVPLPPERQESVTLRIKINTPYSEIKGYLATLEGEMEKVNPNLDLLTSVCFELLCRLHLPIWQFTDGFVLRSRRNFNGEVFRRAAEISYNPFLDKIQHGRFNLAGEAVFYASLPLSSSSAQGYAGAICEASKELFDTNSTERSYEFTVGRWSLAIPINVVVLTFCEPARKNCPDAMRIDQKFFRDMEKAMSADDFTIWKQFQEFFSKRAAQKQGTITSYLLATAFFHALQQRYGDRLGILYSSSMTDNQGLNLVLTRSVIDAGHLVLEGANMIRCVRDPAKYTHYSIFPCSDFGVSDRSGQFAFSYIS